MLFLLSAGCCLWGWIGAIMLTVPEWKSCRFPNISLMLLLSNPGRTGGSLSVGAQYELNANWAVRGSYSFDAAEDSTEHNLNVGAMYKF